MRTKYHTKLIKSSEAFVSVSAAARGIIKSNITALNAMLNFKIHPHLVGKLLQSMRTDLMHSSMVIMVARGTFPIAMLMVEIDGIVQNGCMVTKFYSAQQMAERELSAIINAALITLDNDRPKPKVPLTVLFNISGLDIKSKELGSYDWSQILVGGTIYSRVTL